MNAAERRKSILDILKDSEDPVSAGALASRFSVSRQVIVGDIALLRASGREILATPRGYLISAPRAPHSYIGKIVCRHRYEHMKAELYALIDEGCKVRDVIVEHPVYGQLTGQLELSSRHDVDVFLKLTKESDAAPLSVLTGGIHLHTLICPSKAVFLRARRKLAHMGILVESSEHAKQAAGTQNSTS